LSPASTINKLNGVPAEALQGFAAIEAVAPGWGAPCRAPKAEAYRPLADAL
jgi:hypothetical protein